MWCGGLAFPVFLSSLPTTVLVNHRQAAQPAATLPMRPWGRRQLHQETHFGVHVQAQNASIGGDLFPVSAAPLTCTVPHAEPGDVKNFSEGKH